MGVDHGGDGGQVLQNLEYRHANASCPPQILSYRYKINERSVAFKILQNVFGRGSTPDPTGGAHDAPPDPVVGWEGTPHSAPATDPPSTLAMCPPEFQPDLRLLQRYYPWLSPWGLSFKSMVVVIRD